MKQRLLQVMITAITMMALLALTACGGNAAPNAVNSAGTPESGATPPASQISEKSPSATPAPIPSGSDDESLEITSAPDDIYVESILEDWMIPEFGTIADEMNPLPWLYILYLDDVSSEDVETYKNILLEHGMTVTEDNGPDSITYETDTVLIIVKAGFVESSNQLAINIEKK